MELASGIASLAGIGSLAIQLADTVKKISEFCSSVQDAPEDIKSIVKDLQTFLNILHEIENEGHHLESDANSNIHNATEACLHKANSLLDYISNLVSQKASSKRSKLRWSSIQTVLQKHKVDKLRLSIGETKSSLGLALQCANYVAIAHLCSVNRTTALRSNLQTENADIDALSSTSSSASRSNMEGLCPEVEKMTARILNSNLQYTLQENIIQMLQDIVSSERPQGEIANKLNVGEAVPMAEVAERKTYPPSAEWPRATRKVSQSGVRVASKNSFSYCASICGGIYIRTRTSHSTQNEDDTVLQTRTTFVLHPAPWLLKWCCSYGLKAEVLKTFLQGWKQSLNTYRAVPDDAIIFDFCREESISAVGKLIQAGQASVWDTDSSGRTPLHHAARFARVDMCKAFLEWGADPSAETWDLCRQLPISAVGSDGSRWPSSDDMIDTFRVILKYHDFESTNSESDGRRVLGNLALNTCKVTESSAMPVLWLLQNFCTYLPRDRVTAYYLLGCVFFNHGLRPFSSELLSTIISLYNPILKEIFQSQSIQSVNFLGHFCLSERMLEGTSRQMGDLKNEILECRSQHMKIELAITFDAMKTSWSFYIFRGLLDKLNVDTSSFAERQMQVCWTDIHKRWNAHTLKALFEYKFKPVQVYGNDLSNSKHPLLASRLKETWWCKNVEKIRRGLIPDQQPKTVFLAESEESFEVYSVRVVNEEMMDTLDPLLSDSHDIDPDLYLDLPNELFSKMKTKASSTVS